MAKPRTITRDIIIDAAMDIVHRAGIQSLSSRSLATALGTSAHPVFAVFQSMDNVIDGVKEEAIKLYESYVNKGLSMKPPFKGFGIEFLWFAMDEPEFFKLLFNNAFRSESYDGFLMNEGHLNECTAAVSDTFGLNPEQGRELVKQVWMTAYGLGCMIANGVCNFTIEEAAGILGKSCRAHLLEINAGADRREGYIPGEEGPSGNVDSYLEEGYANLKRHARKILLDSLVSQNHLLSSLSRCPRYVKDIEWTELERLMHSAFGVSAESLKKQFPFLTSGDFRLIMLAEFQFGKGQSAILLGISPASVTKARQRLKAKLGIDSLENFLLEL